MNEMLLRLGFSAEAVNALEHEIPLSGPFEELYRYNVELLRRYGFEEQFLLDLLILYPRALRRADLHAALQEAERRLGEEWSHQLWEDYICNGESGFFAALHTGKLLPENALRKLQWQRFELDDRMLDDLVFLYPDAFEREDLAALLERCAAELGAGWQEVVWQDYIQNEGESCLFKAFEVGTEEALTAALSKLRQTFSLIYITGDTHGHQQRLLHILEKHRLEAGDLLIVLGDFSFIYRDDERERAFLDRLEAEQSCTIAFIDGNHENFTALYAYPEEEWCGGRIHRIRKNIVHLMRGQVFQFRDRTFFTMGGAYSTDRYIPGKSFWEEELPSSAEYHEAIRNLERHRFKVDYMLTHTAPDWMIDKMGHFPDPHDRELTGFLEHLRRTVEHYRWFCGHWHPHELETEKFKVVNDDVVVL